MSEKKCQWCGNSFGDKYREDDGKAYCSPKCEHEAKKAGK